MPQMSPWMWLVSSVFMLIVFMFFLQCLSFKVVKSLKCNLDNTSVETNCSKHLNSLFYV